MVWQDNVVFIRLFELVFRCVFIFLFLVKV
jgi:hypothetical protein